MRKVLSPLDSEAAGVAGAEGLPQVQELSVECAPDTPAQGQPLPQRPGPGRQDRPDGAANGDRCAINRRYPYHVPIAHRQTWKVHRRDIAPAGGNPAIAGPVRPTRNRHHRHTAQEQEVLYALWLGQNRRRIRKAEAAVKSSILHVTEAVKEGRARLSLSDPEQLAEQMEQALDQFDLSRRQLE